MTERFFIIKCEPQSIESLPLVGRTPTRCDGALSIGGQTMKHTKQDQADARERLLGWVKSGDTVYTILRHRAASGMSRRISLVLPPTEKGGRFAHLDSNVAILLGLKGDNGEGVTLSGCGMDMGFHLVYSLAGELFGDGYALKQEWI